jgi:hypothetical protein
MNLITIPILLASFCVQVLMMRAGKALNLVLMGAIILLINSILFAIAVNYFNVITCLPLDGPSSVDKIIRFTSISTHIRNTVVAISLAILSYGFYAQYRSSQKGAYIIASFIVGVVALMFVMVTLMSSMFTI